MSERIEEPVEEPDSPEETERQKKIARWRIFGWSVIVSMMLIVVLNLFQVLDPEVNKVLMIAVVLAYIAYIFFRRRV